MGKLRVERNGYVKRNGVRVEPTTFEITDRGNPGLGPWNFDRQEVIWQGFGPKAIRPARRVGYQAHYCPVLYTDGQMYPETLQSWDGCVL